MTFFSNLSRIHVRKLYYAWSEFEADFALLNNKSWLYNHLFRPCNVSSLSCVLISSSRTLFTKCFAIFPRQFLSLWLSIILLLSPPTRPTVLAWISNARNVCTNFRMAGRFTLRWFISNLWFIFSSWTNRSIGVRDQFRLGGLRSVARIFSPLLARKSSGFARILLDFFFARICLFEKIQGGGGGAAAPSPPPPPPPRTPMNRSMK